MKNCYCRTCNKSFHYLGINSHRAAHRRRGEKCTITYTYGNTITFDWSKKYTADTQLPNPKLTKV